VKLVAEASKETIEEKTGSVEVGGSEDRNALKQAKVWISSFAVGASNVNCGVSSVDTGVQPLGARCLALVMMQTSPLSATAR